MLPRDETLGTAVTFLKTHHQVRAYSHRHCHMYADTDACMLINTRDTHIHWIMNLSDEYLQPCSYYSQFVSDCCDHRQIRRKWKSSLTRFVCDPYRFPDIKSTRTLPIIIYVTRRLPQRDARPHAETVSYLHANLRRYLRLMCRKMTISLH